MVSQHDIMTIKGGGTMTYIFASDPHGTGAAWIKLVEAAKQDYPYAQVVFGGDYIDGKRDVKMTLQYVMNQVRDAGAWALKGNHEQMLQDFVEHGDSLWFINGAKTTLQSIYSRIGSLDQIKAQLLASPYLAFIQSLPTLLETDQIIFVHAGVMPTTNYLTTSDQNRLWMRETYWYDLGTNVIAHNRTGKTIITGHTPTSMIDGVMVDSKGREYHLSALQHPECPVLEIRYHGEPARIFTDNGCHGSLMDNHGNVVVLNDDGEILQVYSDNTSDWVKILV